ncbi:MAG TPA: sigma 54-interacting transcriptional regulator [bacterium]
MNVNSLVRKKGFLQSVLATMSDGVMVVDREGTIVFFNAAAEHITGYRGEEVVGKPCAILDTDTCVYREGGRTAVRCSLFDDGGAVRKSCRIRAKDGREVHLVKNATVLRDGRGGMAYGIETMTDVTSLVLKERQIEELAGTLREEESFHGIVGRNPVMLRLREQIKNAARSEAPVVVLGESGTGKELVAAAVHALSRRREGPFVKVNCAALNEQLLESELFGHRRGAFTGAMRDRQGRLEAASRGTIFLDEIGDMSPAMQAKLLRALEGREIERVGENTPVPVDIRLVSATNRDLETLVAGGAFRRDLLYRVNAIPIVLPPLRERPDDIPLLVAHLLARMGAAHGRPGLRVTSAALEKLGAHEWPGNVRQLINALEYGVVTSLGAEIDVPDLPAYLAGERVQSIPPPGRRAALTREAVAAALASARGNRAAAARSLGVCRVTLWKRLRELGGGEAARAGAAGREAGTT